MSPLFGKKILLGVSASIAAYKAAHLIRLLVKAGADVRVIMTKSATAFITPLTLATLSKHEVYTNFTKEEDSGVWTNHVELGLWADVMLVAPASANTLAKMAQGNCDNLLIASYLSAKCPVFFAPAMDLDMFLHASTQNNISLLQSFGNQLIDAEDGELASGLSGKGRMAEPAHIVARLEQFFAQAQLLIGKKVLITAGPTYEQIDPVRFIGNNSTGKMGYALAAACQLAGAEVFLVSGPTHLDFPAGVKGIRVKSAAEMLEHTQKHFENCDIAILAAAVADYKPANVAEQKIKKGKADLSTIALVETVDILQTLGHRKQEQLLVGFALETQDAIKFASEKLEKKNLDLIVVNTLEDAGAGFGHDTNKVSLIDRSNNTTHIELKSKTEVATDIVNKIVSLLDQRKAQ